MTVTPILRESEHVVQFYEADVFLVKSVCEFIASALAAGDAVLVCVTDVHQQLIETDLATRGIDLGLASENGQYVVLPCGRTLARIMCDGVPSPEKFDAVVGGAVAGLAREWPRVHAFGALVTL